VEASCVKLEDVLVRPGCPGILKPTGIEPAQGRVARCLRLAAVRRERKSVFQQERYAEAAELLEKTLQVFRGALGEEHE
jgi:hypothetical protein